MIRRHGATWSVFVVLLVLVVFVFSLTTIRRRDEAISYTKVLEIAERQAANPNGAAELERVSMTNGDNTVYVRFHSDPEEKPVIVPAEGKEQLIKKLYSAKIPLFVKEVDRSAVWLSMLGSFVLPVVVIVGLLLMFRCAQRANGEITVEQYQIHELQKRIAQLETEIAMLKEQAKSN